MNKRHLHHLWTRFRVIKPWYFLALTVVSGSICAISLRDNYKHMVILRNDVYAADKANGDVMGALNNLRNYVYAHMNTDLATGPDAVYPPIQLKYTYDRLVAAEAARVTAVNTQIYSQAQALCEQLDPVDFSGKNRVPCITDYVNTHGTKPQPVPDALYKFSFISPKWSPDLAGWSLVITIITAILTSVAFIAQRWFKKNVAT